MSKRVDDERIVELLQQGKLPHVIAAECRTTARTVARVAVRQGVRGPATRYPHLTPERIEFLRVLLDEEGWTYQEIQRTYGHNWLSVHRHLPGRGMSPQESGKLGVAARRANAALRAARSNLRTLEATA